MASEIWREIKGYNGMYLISNKGRVYSNHRGGKYLKGEVNNTGYYRVPLTDDNGNKKNVFIHRLVAQTFINNPNNLPYVNHKDFNRKNNNVENLEWVTRKENMEHASHAGHFKKNKKWREKIGKPQRKRVVATNIKTGEIIGFEQLTDVAEYGFQPSCVSQCCNNIRKTHKGYRFCFM